jgi:hypothetical protein
MWHAPGDDELSRQRAVQHVHRGAGQRITLAGQVRISGEQHQSFVQGPPEARSCFIAGHGAKQLKVQAGGKHRDWSGGAEIVLHVLRNHDDCIGMADHEARDGRGDSAGQCIAAPGSDDAEDVAATKRDHERQAFGERQHPTLTELRMH